MQGFLDYPYSQVKSSQPGFGRKSMISNPNKYQDFQSVSVERQNDYLQVKPELSINNYSQSQLQSLPLISQASQTEILRDEKKFKSAVKQYDKKPRILDRDVEFYDLNRMGQDYRATSVMEQEKSGILGQRTGLSRTVGSISSSLASQSQLSRVTSTQQLLEYQDYLGSLQKLKNRKQFQTPLLSSAKMMIEKQPQINNTGNPLLGESEGAARRQAILQQYKKYANSGMQGSLEDGRKRSNSRSKRAKLEEAQNSDDQQLSIVEIMRRSPSAQRRNPTQQPPNNYQVTNPYQQLQKQNIIYDKKEAVIPIAAQPPEYDMQRRKAEEYRATLLQQMAEKKQRSELTKQKMQEQEKREAEEFNQNYKFGNQMGGGAPIRDQSGRVISQHMAFSVQSRRNGGSEIRANSSDGEQKSVQVRKESGSPTSRELVHMRPSNMFEDITEEQFLRREAEKNMYKHELQLQIDEIARKKADEKKLKQLEDMREEEKIKAQLQQMNEQYSSGDDKLKRKQKNTPRQPQKNRQQTPSPKQQIIQQPPPTMKQIEPYEQEVQRRFNLFTKELFSEQTYHQLERLKRLQEDIERKNAIDSFETQKLIKEIVTRPQKTPLQMKNQWFIQQASSIPDQVPTLKHQSEFQQLLINSGTTKDSKHGFNTAALQQKPLDSLNDVETADQLISEFNA